LLALLKDVATISVQVIESTFGWMVGAFDSQVIPDLFVVRSGNRARFDLRVCVKGYRKNALAAHATILTRKTQGFT